MKHYIGCKLIEAEPALRINGEVIRQPEGGCIVEVPSGSIVEEGYHVRYPDGYESWSPKKVFEKAYFQVDDSVAQGGEKVSRRMVDEFISHAISCSSPPIEPHVVRVMCVLRNGTTIHEKFDCVDPQLFDENFGEKMCWNNIYRKIEEHLDFLIKMGKNGIQ